MDNNNLTVSFLVDQSPAEVYQAINNVRGWWSQGVEGGTGKVNDEFVYRHKDLHYSRHRITELIPDKKVVWLITDSNLSFLKHKTEWTGTKASFDISRVGDRTEMLFTHWGLVPGVECFEACTKGWNYYLGTSLLNLITKGEGQPDPKAS